MFNCVLLLSTIISCCSAFQHHGIMPRIRNSEPQKSTSFSFATEKGRAPAMTKLYSSTSERQQQQSSKVKQQQTNNKSSNSNSKTNTNKKKKKPYKKKRKQYARKAPLSPSEKAVRYKRQTRRQAYERMRSKSLESTNAPPSIWSFDSLFRAPVFDEKSVREDLYGDKERESKLRENKKRRQQQMEMEKSRERKQLDGRNATDAAEEDMELTRQTIMKHDKETSASDNNAEVANATQSLTEQQTEPPPVDKTLTRMVEDRINGLTRTPQGSVQYTTSLLSSNSAVQFREGVRLGKPLTINLDRLCHFAKKDLSHGRLEEAQEYYLEAAKMDPSDGRPYLGLSRIAQRRGDMEYARGLLKEGISKSSGGYVTVKGPGSGESKKKKKNASNNESSGFSGDDNGRNKNKQNNEEDENRSKTLGTIPDLGPNPFLLQALGTLEQKMGNLSTAEEFYLQAIRSRPSHAAAWVSLAQLRTRELRQNASAGRSCYQSAERELQRIGAKPNAFVYTAWASMEYKKGVPEGNNDDGNVSLRKARKLYQKALEADPNCSVAYLQLGCMESECENFDDAQDCFEKVLKFDQRNSRVLQAYAIMESRRLPKEDVDSRRVLDLFERALKANPRDAGVYQAYALYVVELGDIDSARDLCVSICNAVLCVEWCLVCGFVQNVQYSYFVSMLSLTFVPCLLLKHHLTPDYEKEQK